MQHCFLGRVLSLLLLTFLLFTAIPLKLLPPLVEGFQITFSVLPKHKIVMHHRFDSQAVSCSNYCFTLKASSSFLFHRDLLRSRPLNCGDLWYTLNKILKDVHCNRNAWSFDRAFCKDRAQVPAYRLRLLHPSLCQLTSTFQSLLTQEEDHLSLPHKVCWNWVVTCPQILRPWVVCGKEDIWFFHSAGNGRDKMCRKYDRIPQ